MAGVCEEWRLAPKRAIVQLVLSQKTPIEGKKVVSVGVWVGVDAGRHGGLGGGDGSLGVRVGMGTGQGGGRPGRSGYGRLCGGGGRSGGRGGWA